MYKIYALFSINNIPLEWGHLLLQQPNKYDGLEKDYSLFFIIKKPSTQKMLQLFSYQIYNICSALQASSRKPCLFHSSMILSLWPVFYVSILLQPAKNNTAEYTS